MPTQVAGEAGEAGVGDSWPPPRPTTRWRARAGRRRVARSVPGRLPDRRRRRCRRHRRSLARRARPGWPARDARLAVRGARLATLVAAHAFVAGETEQHAGRFGVVCVGTHPLVPAPRVGAFQLSIRPCQRLMSGRGTSKLLLVSQPRGSRAAASRVHCRKRSLRDWARKAGAIRLRAPCRRWRLSSSGTLMPQTPSSISPWLTA